MFNVFSTALSALNATSTAIDVVGNNLANMDTTGFKGSDMAFSDLISQSIGSNGGTQVGFGTAQPLTIQDFSQGAIQTETSPLDAAIQGNGFFITQNANGNTLYTRDGTFQVDNSGNLVTATGAAVQGWTALDATGTINTSGLIGNIALSSGALKPPVATTDMTVSLNLNSAATADATSSFSTPVTVYDSLGTSHVLTVDFQKTGSNTWSYQVTRAGRRCHSGNGGNAFRHSECQRHFDFRYQRPVDIPGRGQPDRRRDSGPHRTARPT